MSSSCHARVIWCAALTVLPFLGCETLSKRADKDSPITATPVEEKPITLEKEKKEDPDARMLLDFGLVAFHTGQHDRAIKNFELAIKKDKHLVDAYIGLSKTYVAIDKPEKALEAIEKGLKRDRNAAALWNERGFILTRRNDYEGAATALSRALEIDPNNELYLSNMAGVLAVKGQIDESLALYSRVMPPSEARYIVAGVLHSQGRLAESKALLDQVIAENPRHDRAQAALRKMTSPDIQQASHTEPAPAGK